MIFGLLLLLLFLAGMVVLSLTAFCLGFRAGGPGWASFWCALPVFLFTSLATMANGLPGPHAIKFAYFANWLALFFSTLALLRWLWFRQKNGNRQ